ncbi:MAG: hypothetical protein ACKVJG_28445, partial [Candidatus Latescibacterota bacterium]
GHKLRPTPLYISDNCEGLQPISGTILLVEDEEVLRNLAHRVLRDHGFDVLEARKGEEALVLASCTMAP